MCAEQAIDELLAAEFLHATRCRGLGAAVERALDDLQQLARCLKPSTLTLALCCKCHGGG